MFAFFGGVKLGKNWVKVEVNIYFLHNPKLGNQREIVRHKVPSAKKPFGAKLTVSLNHPVTTTSI